MSLWRSGLAHGRATERRLKVVRHRRGTLILSATARKRSSRILFIAGFLCASWQPSNSLPIAAMAIVPAAPIDDILPSYSIPSGYFHTSALWHTVLISIIPLIYK